jgi:Tfp pilus assembly protein PilF
VRRWRGGPRFEHFFVWWNFEVSTTDDIRGTAPRSSWRVIALGRKGITALAFGPVLVGVAACGSPHATPAQAATTLVTQGLKAQLSGDLATAASDYQQAIHLDGSSMVAHYDLGTVYDKQGNTMKAVAEYRATLVIAPNFSDALFNLAVDTTGSDPVGAAQLYFKVLSLQPTFAAAWLNVGFILQSEGKTGEARADWAKAAALDPSLAARVPSPAPSASGTVVTKASPSPKP